MLQRQIDVSQRLRLNALGRVHHQDCPVASCERPADLIVEVYMSGCIDQVEDILHPVLRLIDETDRLALDRDSAFALQFHIVQDLVLHLAACEKTRPLDHSVGQSGFPVVNMGYDTEISGPLPNIVIVI